MTPGNAHGDTVTVAVAVAVVDETGCSEPEAGGVGGDGSAGADDSENGGVIPGPGADTGCNGLTSAATSGVGDGMGTVTPASSTAAVSDGGTTPVRSAAGVGASKASPSPSPSPSMAPSPSPSLSLSSLRLLLPLTSQ